MPLISVVIPVYNSERYVCSAIESVLRQSRTPRRIILVDDGSTDNTPALLRSFGSAIEVFRQNNQGVGAARNVGIRAADGDYVAFLDADDEWHTDKLDLFSKAIKEHPRANLFFSDAMQIDPDGIPSRYMSGKPRGNATWQSLLKYNWLFTSTALVRRSAAQDVGFFRTDFQCLAGVEDWDFFIRMVRAGPAVYVPGPWTYYRQHSGSAMQKNRLRRIREDSHRVVTMNAAGVSPWLKKQAYALVWFNSGVRNLAALDTVSARHDFMMSLRSWPFLFRSVLLWMFSLLGRHVIKILIKCRKWFLRYFFMGIRSHYFVLPDSRRFQK